MSGRGRLEIGTYGDISTARTGTGTVRAEAGYRDGDGIVRISRTNLSPFALLLLKVNPADAVVALPSRRACLISAKIVFVYQSLKSTVFLLCVLRYLPRPEKRHLHWDSRAGAA
jgi:hypothetical protein